MWKFHVTTLLGCEHLAQSATTLLQPYKVVARLLQPRNFHMGYHRPVVWRFPARWLLVQVNQWYSMDIRALVDI